jgi:hypothetical protein
LGSAASAGKSQRLNRSCLLGLKVLERVDFNKLYERVEFLLGVLVLVSLAGHTDTDFTGNVSDSGSPDLTVKVGVNAHFLKRQRRVKFCVDNFTVAMLTLKHGSELSVFFAPEQNLPW